MIRNKLMKLTLDQILKIAPMAKPEYAAALVRDWPELSDVYQLTSADHTARFLGQIMVETQGLTRLEENLYYTTEARLMKVWPSRFKSKAAARPYVRNPQALANLTYGGRLGNTAPNDGWDYRGSGTPHLTGKANYAMVKRETAVDVVSKPEAVREFPMALEAGMVFWKVNKLDLITDVTILTRRWQGGTGGLADRITYTNRAAKALAGKATGAVPVTPATTVLRRGPGYSDAVKRLQQQLKAKGYNPGLVDGFFGDATERAVQQFQTTVGIIADGIAGPVTLSKLEGAVRTGQHKNPDPDESGLEQFFNWLLSFFNRA
jgi:putative chitinase